MLNKIKFIRNKLLLGIIPTVLIAFLALAILITLSAQTIINDEVSAKVEKQVDFAKEQVVGHLVGHMKLSVGLAKTVEATGITSESKASLIELVKKMPVTNADTLGTGIFMADKYDGQYFGPYAYKSGSEVIYTEDYFADNTQEGWYQVGDTNDSAGWTDPYYDPASSITMITAASPIRNNQGKMIGVATADLDFTNVQKIMSEIKVGKKGFAMLITKDGDFVSKDTEEIKADDQGAFPNFTKDENVSLAAITAEVMNQKNGINSYLDNNGKQLVYYSEIPFVGWIILLTIPESEIMEPVQTITNQVIVVTVGALLVLVFLIVIVSRGITKPLYPLKMDIDAISKGDFTRDISIHSADEIGQIAHSVNEMVLGLRNSMHEIMENASNLASTSEELEASASQNGQAVEQVAQAANDSTGSVVKSIDAGQVALTQVSGAFDKIIINISNINGLVSSADQLAKDINMHSDKVNQSAIELTHLTDQSAEEAASIAAATEEQLASVEEQTSATISLAQMAEGLRNKIGVFKV